MEGGFIGIADQIPPVNERIILRLYDKWLGGGNETEIVTGCYDGTIFKTEEHKQIQQHFVTGWKEGLNV